MVSAKNVTSTNSHQQTKMGVMLKVAPPINDWITLEIARIVKSAIIHQKMVRHVRPDVMKTTRSSMRKENVKLVQCTLTQTQKLKREVVSQINAILRTSISS